jgi:glucose-1-phosphate thymidylyltransferase
MKCIILAAGYATRLYPLTENYPKPLLDVNGKKILDYLIDDLEKKNYIDEYIVVTNHKFADVFREWSKDNNKIRIIDDGTTNNDNRLGALIDLKYALGIINNADDVLVIAGDNLLDFSLNDFIDYSKSKGTSCIMTYELDDIEKLKRTGVLELDEDNRVIAMEEKPSHPKSKYACPPFYYYKNEDIGLLEEALYDECKSDAPGSFISWLCTRTDVYAYPMPGNRYDIGNLESYEEVQKIYKGVNYENKRRIKK